MSSTKSTISMERTLVLLSFVVMAMSLVLAFAPAAMASPTGDLLAVCLRNCAQCKKMFGKYFEGQLCAEACVQFKGQLVPECTDRESIAPYLSNLV
ncbi:eclosion hormone-like [Ischnura elegans]|uniref:eclosion hormone-like n=1 Tax=Ischnura elegans TaxID=197161 RepID=UPI001ED8A5FD|nr:eclosion hormone-like [Ischnura elegans]